MKKVGLIVLITMTLSSCYKSFYVVDGKYQLTEMTSNYDKIESGQVSNGVYHDNLITIFTSVKGSNISLLIENNHNSSIRVLWDGAAFIDISGTAHRVVHSGVHWEDKSNQQVPSVIPSASNIKEMISPVDWIALPFGNKRFSVAENANKLLKQYSLNPRLTTVKLLLPIEVDDKTIEYTLVYVGTDFKVEQIQVQEF